MRTKVFLPVIMLFGFFGCKEEKVFINTVDTSTQVVSDGDLYKLSFYDQMHGLAVGAGGRIYRSDDGGQSWSRITAPSISDDLYDINYISADSVVITAVGVTDGSLHISTNGGTDWAPFGFFMNKDRQIRFQALDRQNWFVLTNGSVMATRSAGSSWNTYPIPPGLVFSPHLMHFVNRDTGFVIDFDRKLIRTDDGGTTWTQKFYGGGVQHVLNGKGDHIYASGAGAGFYISHDKGNNWEKASMELSSMSEGISTDGVTLQCVAEFNESYLASGENALMLSTNGGNSFREFHKQDGTSLRFTDVCLLNEKIGLGIKGGVVTRIMIK